MKQLALLIRILTATALLLACTGCSSASSGVKAKLEPGPTAPLGGTIPFKLTVSSARDAPSNYGDTSAEVRVVLSPGLSMATGGWSEQVHPTGTKLYTQTITFKADIPQTFAFQVKLDQAGEQEVRAGAEVRAGESGRHGNLDTKLLTVSENGTAIRDVPLVGPTPHR